MKLIVLLIFAVVVATTRPAQGAVVRRYFGLVLVSLGAFAWAFIFEAASSVHDVTNAPQLYKRILWGAVIGALLSLSGIAASLWCRDKLLKTVGLLIGVVTLVLCGGTLLTPY